MTCTTNNQFFYTERDIPSPTIVIRLLNNFRDLNHAINSYIFPKKSDCFDIKHPRKFI